VQGGKDAKLRLLDLDNLSGQGGPGHLGGEVGTPINIPQGGELLSHPAVWVNPADNSTWVFVTTSGGLSALQVVVAGNGTPSLVTKWIVTAQKGEGTPVIEGGVLFVPGPNAIIAYDAVTGQALWYAANGGIHWESPALAGGKLFTTDQSAHLTAYGL
jgi:hypothetical protein